MQLLKQSILATDLTLYFEYARFDSTLFIKLLNLLRGCRSQQRDHQFTLKHSEASSGQHCPPVDCACHLHLCVSTLRNRNSFFELVSIGEYNWNVKTHRDMCR